MTSTERDQILERLVAIRDQQAKITDEIVHILAEFKERTRKQKEIQSAPSVRRRNA